MSHLVGDIIAKYKSMNVCEIRFAGFERTHVASQFAHLNQMKKLAHVPILEEQPFQNENLKFNAMPVYVEYFVISATT